MKRLSFFAVAVALLGLTSCGSKAASTAVSCTTTTSTTSTATSTSTCTDPVTGISVTISPATESVNVVTTAQFLAAVSGGTDTIVTWTVNGVAGGNDTVGHIDSNGLYHAPSVVPSPATVNVAAVSFEDANVSATAVVTLLPPPTITFTSPASAVSPTSAVTVTSGAAAANAVAFGATETGGTTDIILWEVAPVGGQPIQGGNATLGTINANGVYTPPLTPPIGSTAIVTAAAQDYPAATASVTVTIQGYSTSSLQGQLGFTVSGSNTSGPFFRAGSFTADGAGNLNGGLEDINDASGVTSGFSFAGTYTVSPDGRGTLTFDDNHGPAPSNTSNFHFVLVNNNQLQIIGSDTNGISSGQANSQDASKFAAGLSGTYVFDFAGVQGSTALSEIGEFTADGSGNIKSGLMGINAGGATTPQVAITGGTYSVPASPKNGQGTATLVTSSATYHFSFYMISQGSAKFVGTDTTQQVAGVISQQAPNVVFSPASLNGNFAFLLPGSGSGATYAAAGNFSANGNSIITTGVLDENVSGAPNTSVGFSGSYTVASNGRGTLTFTGGRTYVFYLGPTGNAVLQETDSIHPGAASDGLFIQQQTAAFTLASIQGNYTIATSGTSGPSGQVIAGQFGANGAGIVPSGMIDINTGGALTTGEAVAAASSYTTPASSGRTMLTLNPATDNRNFAAYVVNSTQVFVVGIDTGRLAAGTLSKRY